MMDAVIANPLAGRGKVHKKLEEVKKILNDLDLDYEIYQTEKPGQAIDFAKKVLDSGKYKRIIILGGDGTINEVIQPLVGSDIQILPIPLGTGNDFVKFFYPYMKYDTILQQKGHSFDSKAVDVGLVEYGKSKRYFINGMGIGFDAEVLNRMKGIKLLKGDFLYTTAVLWTFLSFKGIEVEVVTKEKLSPFRGKFLLFNVGNGSYLGGGFKLFPKAKVDDGLLDVSLIETVSPLRFFTNFYKAFKGKHLALREVHYFKTTGFHLISREPLSIQLDGELIKDVDELKISILKRSLQVII